MYIHVYIHVYIPLCNSQTSMVCVICVVVVAAGNIVGGDLIGMAFFDDQVMNVDMEPLPCVLNKWSSCDRMLASGMLLCLASKHNTNSITRLTLL